MVTGREVFDVFLRPPDDETLHDLGMKAFTVRAETSLVNFIEVMAEHAELSRNAMAVQLIRWGISSAMAQLPDEVRDAIQNDLIGLAERDE
jgi:hypothetical protein